MVDPQDIKQVATSQSVALNFLGLPEKERRNELWYKSPFREETDASFVVSDKGFHDFGTGEHYDMFSFVQRLKKCDFKESVEILASLYGISDREYASDNLVNWYKEQREEKEKYHTLLDWFYMRVWEYTDEEYRANKACLEIFKPHGTSDLNETYVILINEQVSIRGMEEYLAMYCNTWEDKEELMSKAMKGELPTWLMNRLKATMTLSVLNTKLKQKREY